MTKYEKLVDTVCESEVLYIKTDSEHMPACAIRIESDYGILFNESAYKTTAERYVALAHEKAHCDTGSLHSVYALYDERERHEKRANKKATYTLIPLNLLIDALESPWNSVHDLAEYFEVTESFMRSALSVYEHELRKIDVR